MHISSFFKLGFVLIVGLAILKVLFGTLFDTGAQGMQIAFLTLSGVFAVAVIRRGGIINYLEASFVAIVWFVASLIFDFFITASLLPRLGMFKQWYIWAGYIVVMLVIFFP